MATVSHAPGLRPELGATTGEIAVGSVSELVFWGPTQGARALGRGVVRNRNPGAWPSLIPRLSQRTALIAESWLDAAWRPQELRSSARVGWILGPNSKATAEAGLGMSVVCQG